MTQSKEQNKSPETNSKETEVHKLPEKGLNITVKNCSTNSENQSMNEEIFQKN